MTQTSDNPPTHITESKEYGCCSGSLIGTNETGDTVKVIPLFCHRWTCPRCRKQKSAFWREIACAGEPDKFLTFTIRENKNIPAKLQAINMKKAWSKLVQKIRYTFGEFEYLMVWELQENGSPHMHLLVRCGFIPQAWLANEWCKMTGAFKVDIRKIKNKNNIARYITKYIGKDIGRVSEELHGLRIVQRSKRWDLRSDEEKEQKPGTDLTGISAFAFCFTTPKKVYDYLVEKKGYRLDADSSKTCWTLRGPPNEDIESDVLWSLVEEKGFREARG